LRVNGQQGDGLLGYRSPLHKLAWRHAGYGPEYPAEMALVAKAGFQRDFGKRQFAALQQPFGPFDPGAPHVTEWCFSNAAAKLSREV
jgi:hypothetical protein